MLKKIISAAMVFLVLSSFCSVLSAQTNNNKHKKERLAVVKQATVRILKKGIPAGSGFIVSDDGFIITAFHVVYGGYKLEEGNRASIFIDDVEAQLSNGEKFSATAIEACQGTGAYEALSNDYCILKINAPKKLQFLRLGTFADAFEGADVYMCGFPNGGLDSPMVSFGTLSTKVTIAFAFSQNQVFPKKPQGDDVAAQAAYLDITINKGNSGGPVLLLGKEPKDDRVIGITSFQPTPLDKRILDFITRMEQAQSANNASSAGTLRFLTSTPSINSGLFTSPFVERSSSIQPQELKEFASLVADSFNNSSLGIGGCVSIDPAKRKLNKK